MKRLKLFIKQQAVIRQVVTEPSRSAQ